MGRGRRRGCCEKGRGASAVDDLAKSVEFLQGDFPTAGEDVGGELSPVCGCGEVIVGGQDSEVI